ncbi:DUF4255 domain-containing protein [Leptolyngbya sp. FACHB-17]|uniref:DUF4255 domain-containing protein n=1 Tax=unclassified Leptolyngbya TaxID=2650499 RepID=UPI0016805F23|nr:DUF4255 domain-containing protein [Leptolyngbya sp. FACHB-17]MBD2080936.1 DUF4255 domain-containing protein [Leptolyngbya sp. FACHB-17]
MSNELAVAAVTATLRQLLIQGLQRLPDDRPLPNDRVTANPPDIVFGGGNPATDRVNLFLYQILPNAAWRNRDISTQLRSGETGQQPLALTLHYLMSTSGAGDDDIDGHRWLGRAMSILHDNAVLDREAIRTALPRNDLHEQVERVRITPLSLSVEDLTKLWTTFTTPYRLSVAYEVSVILIESARPARTPLPVLDRRLTAQPNLLSPFPTLTDIETPNPQGVARAGDGSVNSGDLILLKGYHLDPEPGETPEIRLQHPRRKTPLQPPNLGEFSSNQLTFRLPDNPDPAVLAPQPLEDPNQWLVGVYSVTVVISRVRQFPDGSSNRETRLTNEIALAIAPRIIALNYNPLTRRLTVTCTPRILPEQRTLLLIGDTQVGRDELTVPNNTLEFTLPATVLAGDYFVRLRVDGIDSLLVRGTPPKLEFDPTQKVTVS